MIFLPDTIFRSFFENSPQAMWIYDIADLRFLAVNKAACARYGYSAKEFKAMTLFDVRSPEETARLERVLELVRETGHAEKPGIWAHRTKEGRRLMTEVLANVVEFGEVRAEIAVLRDVTGARAQKDRLARSEANLAWAQRISHLGSWSMDLKTEAFSLSDEYYRITGYEPGGFEPLWANIVECVHPDDRKLVDRGPQVYDQSTWQPETIEVRIVRPTGELRYVLSHFDVIFGPDGVATGLHGTIQDITERKSAEEARTWLAEIVSSSGESIIGTSLDGTVLSWNKASAQLFGYSADEMVGQNILRLVPPKRWGEAEDILNRLRRGLSLPEFETERIDRNGRIFEASFMMSPVRTGEGRIVGAAAICRDISARKETERQLADRLAQLIGLRKIDTSITQTFDLKQTLEVVSVQTLATTDVESVSLYVTGFGDSSLAVVASGSRAGILEPEWLESADRLAAKANRKRRMESTGVVGSSFLGHDGGEDRAYHCDARPLIAKHSVLGVMTVHYRAGVKRSAEQFHFLDTIAGQAAIAIESARLFEGLERSRDDLAAAYDETLEGWARALDLRDKETEGHCRRVTDLTMRLALDLGLSEAELPHIRRGALLHDIGKIGVPDHILLKQGPLTDDEWLVMRKHPVFGREILAPIEFLAPALDIPYCHHERWDGSGYPRGLKGEEIPMAARVFAFADVWDALSSDRPYRTAWPKERIREYIAGQSGIRFDPTLAPTFLRLIDELTIGSD